MTIYNLQLLQYILFKRLRSERFVIIFILKGVTMWFLFLLFFSVLCSCLCVYKICSYKAQSLPQKDVFYLKEKNDPARAKTSHSNTPHTSTSRCGNICIMPPKCSHKERRRGFSYAVVLMQPCQRDAVSVWTRKHFIWPSESRYIYDFYDPSDFALIIWRFWISDCKYVLLLV